MRKSSPDFSQIFISPACTLPGRPARPTSRRRRPRRSLPGGEPRAVPAEAAGGDAAGGGDCCKADDSTPPLDLVKATPKGGFTIPIRTRSLTPPSPTGHKTYLSAAAMAAMAAAVAACARRSPTIPGLLDDDTLFRLVSLGGPTAAEGDHRVKQEVVVGPMPPFGGILKTSDQLWKIFTFIRSVNPSLPTKPPLQ